MQKQRAVEQNAGMSLPNPSMETLGGTKLKHRGPGPLGVPDDVDREFEALQQEILEIKANATKDMKAKKLAPGVTKRGKIEKLK